MHIVLVEDDDVIRETTQMTLERFGYTVSVFADGRDGFEYIVSRGADVVLLDLMLPTMNGASICREIRAHSNVPIIMLSARSDAIDIVQALEAGADDYLTKPFDMQVLNARIRSVQRRYEVVPPQAEAAGGAAPATPPAQPTQPAQYAHPAQPAAGPAHDAQLNAQPGQPTQPVPRLDYGAIVTGHAPVPAVGGSATPRVISLGPLVIDTSQLSATLSGKQVHLTPTEFRIMLMFAEQPGQVFSREDIARVVWDTGWSGDLRAVDVHIQRLRKKIGQSRIVTVRGFGYRFVV